MLEMELFGSKTVFESSRISGMENNKAKYNRCIHRSLFVIRPVILILSGILVMMPLNSFTQEYGLGFSGAEAVKDKRTKLDLNHEAYYSFRDDFELSFNMRLRPTIQTHFGYVARILDKNGQNIDIIYNGPESHSLQIIYGQELTSISLPGNYPGLSQRWTEIRLKIDLKDKSLRLSLPDTSLVETDVNFNGRVKILFGANSFEDFKTSDVPAMNLNTITGRCFLKLF
jgi:hypothetical protein